MTVDEAIELKSKTDFTIKKWNGQRFVGRMPYYWMEPHLYKKHPWHYLFFSQFKLYRSFVGGCWHHLKGVTWVRMEDYGKQEFCHDHSEIQPCEYCIAVDEAWMQK